MFQRSEQVDCRIESHPLAIPGDVFHSDDYGEMRSACARVADQYDFVHRVGERHLSVWINLRSTGRRVDIGRLEVEAYKVGALGVCIWW